MLCTVAITKEEDTYIARDIVTNVTDEGDTPEEALTNLREALALYYDEDTEAVSRYHAPIYTTTLEVPV